MAPSLEPQSESSGFNALEVILLLRSAGGAFLAQAAVHGQLARIEWAQERERLLLMLVWLLLGSRL